MIFPKFLAMAAVLLSSLAGAAATATELELRLGAASEKIDRAELLAHPQAADIAIERDVAYRQATRYRAVPLAALLTGRKLADDATLQATATDGFVAQIPLALALGRVGPARAWVAIEPEDRPWPPIPGKQASAGPFYLVWENAAAGGIGPEQWPYMMASLAIVDHPARRWPEIAVATELPANDQARLGQEVFLKQCFACHRMNGGGAASVGPDLNLPMNPVEYFQPAALRKYLRDPASVRHWPDQKMPGFGIDHLSADALDQLVAYLQHMSGRKAER